MEASDSITETTIAVHRENATKIACEQNQIQKLPEPPPAAGACSASEQAGKWNWPEKTGNGRGRRPRSSGPSRPPEVSNQSTGTLRPHARSRCRMRAQNVGPESASADDALRHARFRSPCPSKGIAPIIEIIAANRARNPCDSVMVNKGLEIMHKRSYVALRSVRQPSMLPDGNTSNSERLASRDRSVGGTNVY